MDGWHGRGGVGRGPRIWVFAAACVAGDDPAGSPRAGLLTSPPQSRQDHMVYFAILPRLWMTENRKRRGATRPLRLARNGRIQNSVSSRIFCDEIGTEGCVENFSYQPRPAELLIYHSQPSTLGDRREEGYYLSVQLRETFYHHWRK